MVNDYTTIKIKKTTVDLLKDIGKKSETYDDIIVRLVNNILNRDKQEVKA